jgi:hypothetical protein
MKFFDSCNGPENRREEKREKRGGFSLCMLGFVLVLKFCREL